MLNGFLIGFGGLIEEKVSDLGGLSGLEGLEGMEAWKAVMLRRD